MKSKGVKVWVVWQEYRGRYVAVNVEFTKRAALEWARREVGIYLCRITSGTVMPPGTK